MSLDLDELRRLSAFIEEAMALPAESRAAWLDQLSSASPAFKARLWRALQVTDAALATATVPVVATGNSSAVAGVSNGMQWLKDGQLASLMSGSSRSSDPGAALSPGDMLERYRLEKRLGSGGMGEVWLAFRTDGAFSRSVAVKIPLQLGVSAQTKARFTRECQALARLNHPHIAALHDAGVSERGRPYLVMEYVDGLSITAFADGKRLTVERRIRLFLQALDAVAHAHGQLIVHRDLKPSNMLVTAAGVVKLLDFGVASLLANDDPSTADLTQLQGVAITPNYASPEQLRGEPVAVVSDVYSLGIMMYELLVGARPYSLAAGTGIDALEKVNVSPPSRAVTAASLADRSETQLRTFKKKLSGDWDAITMKALALDATQRYLTVREMADDIGRALSHQPVRAASAGNAYIAAKFLRRHWFAAAAAVALTASLLVGAGLTVWQAGLAKAEAKRAQAVESFLLRVFDANAFSGADPLNASGSTARELLDNGARLIDVDASLTGLPLRDVLSVMAQVNADLGEHAGALRLAAKALEVEREADGMERTTRVNELQLIVANAAMLSGDKAMALAALDSLNALDAQDKRVKGLPLSQSKAQGLLPSQTLLLDALNAYAVRDSDWPAAVQLAARAMTSLPLAANDRYLSAGVQRLAEVFSDHEDVATHRLQALALALTRARHGEDHPRTIEARLRVIDSAAAAGDTSMAQQEIATVKGTLTGETAPTSAFLGGWWLPAGRKGLDSPSLIAAALTFGRFELSHGRISVGMLDVAHATTIAARLRTGTDTSLALAARTAYADLALKTGQLELADIHSRAAVVLSKQINDDRAATAAELRADYFMLQGDGAAAREQLQRADVIRAERGSAQRPSIRSQRILREASLSLIDGAWLNAEDALATLDTHLSQATYRSRSVDMKRGDVLRAFVHLDQLRPRAHSQLSSAARSVHANAALRLSEQVLSAASVGQKMNNSEQRLAAAAHVIAAAARHHLGQNAAACAALAQASESFSAHNDIYYSGAATWSITPLVATLKCAIYPAANAAIVAVDRRDRFAREAISSRSPLLTGRTIYVLN